jgi:Raf kinase inhibitor-like YbhB/YbcL family protein
MKIARPLAAFGFLLASFVVPAFAQQGPPPGGARPGGGGPPGPPLQLSTSAFSDGGMVPDKYTCAAGISKMVSPPLTWANAPKGTESFILLLHDPDAHAGKSRYDITHWMMFNIPGDATSLPEGVKADSTLGLQATNTMRQPSFFGPCAPPGPVHHYTFELLALDTKLDLPAGASRDDIMKAADGHVLTGTVYIGLFHRTAGGPPPQ